MIRENVPALLSQLSSLEAQCRETRNVLLDAEGAVSYFEREEIAISVENKQKILNSVNGTFLNLQAVTQRLKDTYASTELVEP